VAELEPDSVQCGEDFGLKDTVSGLVEPQCSLVVEHSPSILKALS
jgi:hypothetical protein